MTIRIEYNGDIPRTNQRYYKNFSLRPEYRDAKERLGWQAKLVMQGKEPLKCPVKVYIELSNQLVRGDIDSSSKAVLDALEGIVYLNDKQVKKLTIEFIDSPVKMIIEIDHGN